MNGTWDLMREAAEILGMILLPIIGWTLHTVLAHSKKIIVLEERVNDSLTRRLGTLEGKVDSLEIKIDAKIDNLEESVIDCKLTIHEKINEKFDTIIEAINKK